ncbi:interleukin-10 receptor subunit beta-like [Aquarana catesbeiana]|uniref:interleukin-10 receptor subunit beta-like n=1 Tax=Aquarana catesbeiana TaxID=8400 RepID=UPI003CC99A83
MYPYTILAFLCLAIPGFGKLLNPTNVRMDSVNFKNILRWNPPPGFTEDEDIVYKVQYKLDVNKQMKYTDVCMTRDLECDLTYITYTFDARVSAAVGDNQSDWVTIRFEPESKSFWKLLEPTNVRMDSINFKNILRWNPPPGFTEDEDVVYTVQYKLDVSKPKDYFNVCMTKELKCDLTDIKYKCYARVSAAVGDNQSEWVTIRFDPYSETVIGPPEVLVFSRSGHLDISMSGPFVESDSKQDTIKEKYGERFYKILYWKDEDPFQVLAVNTSQSTKTLTGLEKWTNYCLKVQAYMPEYEKEGQFSPTICEKTTSDGRIPWWQIAGVFLITMLFTMTAFLGLCYFGFTAYKRWRSFPSYSIPEHMKEFLNNPFNNTPTLPPQPLEECGESCEPLTFLSEENEETKEETNETA